MKKIVLAVVMLTLIAPAANAKKHRRTTNDKIVTTSATATPPGTRASAAVNVDGPTNTTVNPMQQSTTVKAPDPTNPNTNGGMSPVPDHAYTPAGTEAVGVYGNGTGGSTIGSTPDNGGTGVTRTMSGAGSNTKAKSRASTPGTSR